MIGQYGHVLLFLVFGLLFPIVSLSVSSLVRFKSGDKIQATPYECGMEPIGTAYVPFHIGFYVFALLFVVFDLEALFMIPWAVVFRDFGLSGAYAMGAFMMVLVLGLAYVWKRGALRWER